MSVVSSPSAALLPRPSRYGLAPARHYLAHLTDFDRSRIQRGVIGVLTALALCLAGSVLHAALWLLALMATVLVNAASDRIWNWRLPSAHPDTIRRASWSRALVAGLGWGSVPLVVLASPTLGNYAYGAALGICATVWSSIHFRHRHRPDIVAVALVGPALASLVVITQAAPHWPLEILLVAGLAGLGVLGFSTLLAQSYLAMSEQADALADVLAGNDRQRAADTLLARRVGTVSWGVDLVGRTIIGADVLRDALGWEATFEQLMSLDPVAVPPEDRETVADAMRRVYAGEQEVLMEHRFQRSRDGMLGWCRSAIACVRDPSGRPVRLEVASVDLTEQRSREFALQIARDRADQALEELQAVRSEQEHAALSLDLALASANAFWVRVDMVQHTIEHSDRVRETFGRNFTFNQFIRGMMIHPDDRAGVMRKIHRFIRQRISGERLVCRANRADGQEVWVQFRGLTISDANGNLVEYVNLVQDITEEVNRERELAEARDRAAEAARNLSTTLNVGKGSVIDVDFQTRTVAIDEHTSPWDWVCTLEDFNSCLFAHPDDRARVIRYSKKAMRDLQFGDPIVYRANRRDGRRVWVEAFGKYRLDDQGRPVGMTNVVFDVTAREEARIALEEASRLAAETAMRLDVALADNNACIVDSDFQSRSILGHHNCIAVLGSVPTFEDLMDFSMVHPDERERVLAVSRAAALRSGPVVVEFRAAYSTGADERWLEARWTAQRHEGGEARRIVMIITDITDRHQAMEDFSTALAKATDSLSSRRTLLAALASSLDIDMDVREGAPVPGPERARQSGTAGLDALYARLSAILAEIDVRDASLTEAVIALEEAKKDAEAASYAKSQFLANMSHELRTPLNAVIGYAEILEEDLGPAGHDQSARDAAKIRRAARHLLSLINEILDLSKIEAGRMELDPTICDLDTLLADVSAVIEPMARSRGNELITRFEPLGCVEIDDTKLRQCLLNLLSNATKFTENGVVRLEARRGSAGRLEFIIQDSGIGMNQDQLSRLFERFMQADSSTTRRFGGTGLGLVITRELARLMGGDVTATSIDGVGSTFTLTVTPHQAAVPTQRPNQQEAA